MPRYTLTQVADLALARAAKEIARADRLLRLARKAAK